MAELPEYLVPILKRIAKKEGFVNFTTDVGSGSNVGDNFAGELLKAVISGKQKQKDGKEIESKLNLLCKLAPANAQRRKEFLADFLFGREAYFYNTVAPEFVRFQQEKGLSEEDQFRAFPKCYEAVCDPENEIYAIIMQDLRPEGFGMWPKQEPLPPTHWKLYVRELAKFHAISFAMRDQLPEQFEKFKKMNDVIQLFVEDPKKTEFFQNCYKRAIDALEKDECKNAMREIKNNVPEYVSSSLGKEAADRYGVVSHGDSWNNNLLFRSNEELDTIEDICFVDWQIARYASPVTDLLYHFTSSTDKKTRDAEIGNVFRAYHEQLSNNIRKMGSDPEKLFPYETFEKELKLRGNIGFFMAPMIIEITQVDPKDVANMDEMAEKVSNGEDGVSLNLIQRLSDSAQLAYNKRVNEVIGDLVEHGYFQKLKM